MLTWCYSLYEQAKGHKTDLIKGPFTLHMFWMHLICILSVHTRCASKSVYISNWTSELNWYMMGGGVRIVSRASTSTCTCTFHHWTMETIELCVFFAIVFVWMLMCKLLLSEIWKGVTGANKITGQRKVEHQHVHLQCVERRGWAFIRSRLQSYGTSFDNALWQCTSMLSPHYHTTMKAYPSQDFCILAMNN